MPLVSALHAWLAMVPPMALALDTRLEIAVIEGREQEEEQGAQGEQPPAVDKAGLSAAPALEEVGPMGPSMTLGEEAQERWEVPASRSAWRKERAV